MNIVSVLDLPVARNGKLVPKHFKLVQEKIRLVAEHFRLIPESLGFVPNLKINLIHYEIFLT